MSTTPWDKLAEAGRGRLEEYVEQAERLVGQIWKTLALHGVLGVAFGIALLMWPGIGLTAMIALFGAFSLLAGLASIVGAFDAPTGKARAWLVIQGLLGVAAGVVVVLWPGLSALGLLYAIAALATAIGLAEIGAAFALPLTGSRSLLLLLSGVVSIAFGAIMFVHPGAGALALLALIAAFSIVTGLVGIGYAIELRRVVAQLERRRSGRPTAKPVTQG
jgi:uncharacterized membrane protein HdeD (DUF308 family)